MTIVKGTEVIVKSFQEQLKIALNEKQQPGGKAKKLMASLLFQFIKDVTGYLDVVVVYIDKLRSGSGSPYATKMRSSPSSPKVVSILGKVNGVLYYCRKGELCEPDQDKSKPRLAYPRVKVTPKDGVSEQLALALIGETMKRLEFFILSDRNPVPLPCNGFVIKYLIRSTDESMGKRKFAFIEKSNEVQNYKQAIAIFSSRQQGDAAQKKLQRMQEILIYAGQWISVEKDLSPKVTHMDVRIAGVTPADLVADDQSAVV